MNKEITKAVALEKALKQTLDESREDLFRKILNAPAVSGCEELGTGCGCCVTVSMKNLEDGNLAASTYSQKAQAEAVQRKLACVPTMAELVRRTKEMLETGVVRFGSNDACRLNQSTLAVLRDFLI